MKVFEVITEHCADDSDQITRPILYVTSEDGTLKSVVDHYVQHCFEYEKELLGVREILTVVDHVKPNVESPPYPSE